MNAEELDQVVETLLDHPADRAQIVSNANLTPTQTVQVEELLAIADAVWIAGYEPPARESDPVAAMLGLIPDPALKLNPRALAKARQKARVDIADVARQLQMVGWEYTTADVFRWETKAVDNVPPAVMNAVADFIGADVDSLVASPNRNADRSVLAGFVETDQFASLVERWAAAVNVPQTVAAAELRSRSLATVHRGAEPDEVQLMAVLDALVTSVERRAAE